MATQNVPSSNESTFKNIISKSDLIKEGSPSVYKLTTKVENIGTLRRVTFGKKDPKKTNKTILLVGERGAGKSTLINALFNYTMGVKFEDDVWFKFVEEEERSQSESQTSDVIVYHIFGFEGQTLPYSLTIIDTPGYGNTTKPEQDLIVSHRLFDLFRSDDGVHQVDVVGLVMKASMNRVNERLKYIFDSVMSLFGKDLEKNIVALLTHSDGMRPDDALEALKVAEIKCAKDEENQPVYFLFNNCQHKD
ncbi:septin-5 [Kryptolebias marmoratus]|uniref:septin-5 n=1 Tax=Kryptolebias marmoratus TaxID=37003 RepID=UPI0007F8DFA1|nr:septin-5 [Kryptolebias marmoratus]